MGLDVSIRIPGNIQEADGYLDCDRALLLDRLREYDLTLLDVIDPSICRVHNVEVDGKQMVCMDFHIP